MGSGTGQPPADGALRRGGWLWVACAALALLGVLAAAGRVPGATPDAPMVDSWAGSGGDEILGTRGPDELRGTSEGDLIFAFGGDDRVDAGVGNDLIDPGNGADFVAAEEGDDRIRAFDAERDTIGCGTGTDVVFADRDDIVWDCEEVVEADDLASPATPDPPNEAAPDRAERAAPLVTGTIDLADETWQCLGPVDLDLVRVRMGKNMQGVDAVSLGPHCSGRIGRIEVDTWSGDAIKVQNAGVVAHDLVIESGRLRCHARTPGYHQDGIQVMGGERLRFREITVQCGGDGVNAALFIARGGAEEHVPIDVVFERGVLGPGAAQTVFLADSLRSGLRDSIVCRGRFAATRIHAAALDPVDEGNTVADATHRACRPT